MKQLLLHICCGPCAITPCYRLQALGFEISGLFYNPNIQPSLEYLKRLEAANFVAEKININFINPNEIFDEFSDSDKLSYNKDNENNIYSAYNPQVFFRTITFKETKRCLLCYALRLKQLIWHAVQHDFKYISTTLLYSRYQKHEAIANMGKRLAKRASLKFVYMDFREDWQKGIDISKDWGMYRQSYCGCLYSEQERYAKKLKQIISKI